MKYLFIILVLHVNYCHKWQLQVCLTIFICHIYQHVYFGERNFCNVYLFLIKYYINLCFISFILYVVNCFFNLFLRIFFYKKYLLMVRLFFHRIFNLVYIKTLIKLIMITISHVHFNKIKLENYQCQRITLIYVVKKRQWKRTSYVFQYPNDFFSVKL